MADALASAEDALRAQLTGTVTAQAELASRTTLRVGGAAALMVEAEDDADLVAVGRVAAEHRVPWTVIGRGSNLLISDDGWPGIVIRLGRGFSHVAIRPIAGDPDHADVLVGAATPMPALAVRCARADLVGLAWAAGVPGNVGGGVRMNAGAHGGELSDVVVEIEVVRLRSGTRETWPEAALGFSYRRSRLPADAVVVSARLRVPRGDGAAELERIRHVKSWRREHQPIGLPSCGSVFTNPPGDSAGRLIDAAGLKGERRGGAAVSSLHANFITTESGARAADVLALIRHVRSEVQRSHGVTLHPEVVLLGSFPEPQTDDPDDRDQATT